MEIKLLKTVFYAYVIVILRKNPGLVTLDFSHNIQDFLDCFSGATHSKMVLMNEKGDILAWTDGPSTNQWVCSERKIIHHIIITIN